MHRPYTSPSALVTLLAASALFVGCQVSSKPSVDALDIGGGDTPGDSGVSGDANFRDNYPDHILDKMKELSTWKLDKNRPKDPTNAVAKNDRAAKLGQFLFYDKGLSANGEVSCSSCHKPNHGFSAPTKLADQGIGETSRNAPTLINVGFQTWYFWAGRADTLWAQAIQPIESPIEMGSSRLEVAHYIHDNQNLKQAYEAIGAFDDLPDLSNTDRFPEEGRPVEDPQSQEEQTHNQNWQSMSKEDRRTINRIASNVMKSIAAFEMRLTSLNTPFDTFVEGVLTGNPEKRNAISAKARKGFRLFVGDAKCSRCHQDSMFSAPKFHTVGPPTPDWLDEPDMGRWEAHPRWQNDEFNAASRYSDAPDGNKAQKVEILPRSRGDKGAMKVPTLRGLEKTAPYFHGGHFESIRDVLEFYNKLENDPPIGSRSSELETLDFNDKRLGQLEAFLKTLDREGAIPDKFKKQPDSPTP